MASKYEWGPSKFMIVLKTPNCVNRALQTGTILHLPRVVVAWVLFSVLLVTGFCTSSNWLMIELCLRYIPDKITSLTLENYVCMCINHPSVDFHHMTHPCWKWILSSAKWLANCLVPVWSTIRNKDAVIIWHHHSNRYTWPLRSSQPPITIVLFVGQHSTRLFVSMVDLMISLTTIPYPCC